MTGIKTQLGMIAAALFAVGYCMPAPVTAAPNMCWFWIDSAQAQGYRDYCTSPY